MDMMQKARSRMAIKHAFFASLVLSTDILEKSDEWFAQRGLNPATACTDMKKIYYNAAFINGLQSHKVVMFVLAHEVFHIMLKHGLRRQNRNPEKWNIACDHAINLQLKAAGFELWDKCYQDPKYEGMSAEQIYELLPDQDEVGGGVGGDLIGTEGLTPAEIAEIEQDINQKVAQAASQARMRGQLPKNMERLIDGILNPPLPWQQILREYMTQSSHDDESWNRRNRRFQNVYLPTRWSESMGEVVMIGDTSGSIGNETFAQVGGEIAEIVEQVKPERVRMIWADDEDCSRMEVWERHDTIKLHPEGGGGTDMRKPLAFIEQFNPIVGILITDGYTPWPAEETPYPLIVCCTTDVECPDWARVVRIRV